MNLNNDYLLNSSIASHYTKSNSKTAVKTKSALAEKYKKQLGEIMGTAMVKGPPVTFNNVDTNDQFITQKYHSEANHTSLFKNCKACRVILNFKKWSVKEKIPFDITVDPAYPNIQPLPSNTYKPPKKSQVSAAKKDGFAHLKKENGVCLVIKESQLHDYSPTSTCFTSCYSIYDKKMFLQLCTCGEFEIKWL